MSSILCKKCLIGQNAEDYLQMIEKSRAAVPRRDRTDDAAYRRRIALCEECSYLQGPTCMACGCYVELRAIRKNTHCPYKKW